MRNKKNKEELLEKRREKLNKLFSEEDNTYQIELMVKKNLEIRDGPAKPKTSNIAIEVLKDVNCELKKKEQEKRKREAELKLYHQWRINNPIVRQFESKYRFKDLKLSWLDQQIEKRMQKENEEKECKRLIKEQEEIAKKEQDKEEAKRRENEAKKVKLNEDLNRQVEKLKEKQKIGDELREKEVEEIKYKSQLEELEKKASEEMKRRVAKVNALYNIKQHKLKLKQKANDVQEALAKDKELILKMKRLELEELIIDERKKNEIKYGLKEFLCIVRQQQELERGRLKSLEFLFDSEAKNVYEKQLAIWNNEEIARQKLLKDVLDSVNKQIEDNLEKSKEAQQEILKEREEIMSQIEQYDEELQNLKAQEEIRKLHLKKILEKDIKLKNTRKKQEENSKLKQIDEELQRVKREEERLQKEIMEIQRRKGPIKHIEKTRLFY